MAIIVVLLSLFTLRMLSDVCIYSTSCLDRAGSVQFVEEVHTQK